MKGILPQSILVSRAGVCMADDVFENRTELPRVEGERLGEFVGRVIAAGFLPMAGSDSSCWVLEAGGRALAVIGVKDEVPRYVEEEATPLEECVGAGEAFFNRRIDKVPQALHEELVNKRIDYAIDLAEEGILPIK